MGDQAREMPMSQPVQVQPAQPDAGGAVAGLNIDAMAEAIVKGENHTPLPAEKVSAAHDTVDPVVEQAVQQLSAIKVKDLAPQAVHATLETLAHVDALKLAEVEMRRSQRTLSRKKNVSEGERIKEKRNVDKWERNRKMIEKDMEAVEKRIQDMQQSSDPSEKALGLDLAIAVNNRKLIMDLVQSRTNGQAALQSEDSRGLRTQTQELVEQRKEVKTVDANGVETVVPNQIEGAVQQLYLSLRQGTKNEQLSQKELESIKKDPLGAAERVIMPMLTDKATRERILDNFVKHGLVKQDQIDVLYDAFNPEAPTPFKQRAGLFLLLLSSLGGMAVWQAMKEEEGGGGR